MSQLTAGEYDVTLNGVQIHCTVRGSGPVMIAHSGGPGMDARGWDDFAKTNDFVTIVAVHPRGSGLRSLRPEARTFHIIIWSKYDRCFRYDGHSDHRLTCYRFGGLGAA